MAAKGVSVYDLQRQMMEDDIAAERGRTSRALQGQTGRRAAVNAPQHAQRAANAQRSATGQRREGFDPHQLAPYPTTGASPNAVAPYSDGPAPGSYRPDRLLDVHEILKQEAFASSAASCDDHFEKNRPCPSAVYGVSDQYMILDSFEKVETSKPNLGELQFNFMIQGVTANQNIGVKDKLDTIIGIQVCAFDIPLLPFDTFNPALITALSPGLAVLSLAANGPLPATGDALSNPQSQTPFGDRVIMFLKEIGLQSFSDADNRRHHFEFCAKVIGAPNPPAYPDGDRILLSPLKDCEYFLFTDPIQDIDGLTLCFYNPKNPIQFPPDCLFDTVATSDAAQLLTFTYTDPTGLLNLAVGDRIFIRGFVTGNALLDNYIGRPAGQIVGLGGFTITAPGPAGVTVTFRLNPDVSVAAYYAANTTIASQKSIVICIAKNRIRVPMRFRRVVGRLTNYIAP